MGKQSESVGIAFEMRNIIPKISTYTLFEMLSRPFGKEGLDGFFTTMTEWRITHIVRQTSSTDNGSYLFEQRVG